MNAKIAKLLRQKAKEENWTPEQIKSITDTVCSLNGEGRAIAKKIINLPPQHRSAVPESVEPIADRLEV